VDALDKLVTERGPVWDAAVRLRDFWTLLSPKEKTRVYDNEPYLCELLDVNCRAVDSASEKEQPNGANGE